MAARARRPHLRSTCFAGAPRRFRPVRFGLGRFERPRRRVYRTPYTAPYRVGLSRGDRRLMISNSRQSLNFEVRNSRSAMKF